MSIDITRMSAKELGSLINEAKKRKTTLSKRKPIAVVRKKMLTLAKNEGYTIAELFDGAAPAATRAPRAAGTRAKPAKARKTLGKVAPKYRNPDNTDETWTGRGKQPRWLAALTSQGRSVDEFMIK
ncbi:MAG TPA: H-NS histone family protein [Lysobacter sp.]